MLIVGIAAALWTASGYVGAFMRAVQRDLRGRRGPARSSKLRPLQMLVTLILVVLLALVLVADRADRSDRRAPSARPSGLGGTAVTAWNIAKWPVLLLVVVC